MRYFLIPACCLFFMFMSCLPATERAARKEIREKYQAEEVRVHASIEKNREGQRYILELIILNSPLLRESKSDFEECHQIAKSYYRAIQNKKRYDGLRVILSNRKEEGQNLGFSKNYYFDKKLLGK